MTYQVEALASKLDSLGADFGAHMAEEEPAAQAVLQPPRAVDAHSPDSKNGIFEKAYIFV